MSIQPTPTVLPLLIVTALLLSLAAYAWNKRQITGARTFILLMVGLAFWALGHLGVWVFVALPTKFLLARLQYFFIMAVPVLWLLFTLEITGRAHTLKPSNIFLLSLIPGINFIVAFTNPLHGLFWEEIELTTINNVIALSSIGGIWFWIHAGYSYLMLLGGTLILIRAYRHASGLFRQQLLFLLIGSFAPWLANAITIFDWGPASWDGLDLTPFGFFLTGLTMAWALFRYRLLDIVPVARELVVDEMSDGVIVLNLNQEVIDINGAAQAIVATSGTELIGQTAAEAFAPWFAQLNLQAQAENTQNEITIPHGKLQSHYNVSTSPLHSRLKQNSGWVMVLRDITERKKMEQELRRARDEAITASNLKTRLLANVSHDLRTPLGAILGYTEMLQDGVYGEINPEQNSTLTNIMDSTEQLLQFVTNLIGQAQLESGRLVLNHQEINPTDFLATFQSAVSALAHAKGLDLQIRVAPEMPATITGDSYWLQQIILNLISNAVKFTIEGTISVTILAQDETYWAIQVKDSGIGIAAEFHESIFKPFQQAENPALDNPQGSGLGLSIVHQLTTLMGGKINLESQLDQGSTFTILLPWQVAQGNPL